MYKLIFNEFFKSPISFGQLKVHRRKHVYIFPVISLVIFGLIARERNKLPHKNTRFKKYIISMKLF